MRKTILLALALPMILVGGAFACTVSGAYFSGQFDDSGQFVLESALNSSGKALDGVTGLVFTSVATADDVVLPTAAGQILYAHGDLDFDNSAVRVKGFTTSQEEAAATVAKVQGAGYATAGAGSGCSAAKAASAGSGCGSKSAATAATASAGSGCGSQSAATTSAGSGCGSPSAATAASAASAGASCCPSAGSAKSATAAKSASTTAAAAAPIAMTVSSEAPASKCGPDCAKACCAAASAETADSKSECGPDCVKACCAAYAYTYQVSGMTCGGCAAKVEKAAMAVDEKDIASCTVDYKAGTAVVTAREEMDTEQIAKAITATGFPAEFVVEDDEADSEKKEKAPASDEDPAATM